ncbi:DUF1015 domain-containing protein [Pedobacter insulae]|uniref:Uncharacterized conserved protein, DUF1015 family n=1 Tax=Pedobacter insulae TaxID=414048 RepID=A0A1I2WM55_9SPHI|nr:DUF1015 family protein [Pedobacter insulae]SFH02334.1 Uncharacterized conserved protein, DUF1015 family [Pedobacter insulae]
MPRIKPFYALKPAMHLQNSIVTRPLENYSLGQARLMASENPHSFLHLINPELDNPYLRGSRQELIYKKINENLEHFLENEVIKKEDKPAIYIYRVIADGLTQNGIWTLTHINDYLDGNIKKHESTVERREKLLSEYLQQTGLDANPVLITYAPNEHIDQVIAKYQERKPDNDFVYQDGSQHQLWTIELLEDLNCLVAAFGSIPTVYIADGHHRIASMAKMAKLQRTLTTEEEDSSYNYFSTAYFNTKEVKIMAFNRMVKDLNGLRVEDFFSAVGESFEIEKVNEMGNPSKIHELGVYIDKSWYRLVAKPHVCDENDPVAVLDVSILQDYILEPILAIKDPRTDARITFEGDKTPISDLQRQVDNGHYAVAFTLYPTSIQQLIAVADINGVMPPKSTWVEPKFLVGMLINRFI